MPYVQRNQAGKIVGVYANLQEGYAEEWLPPESLQPTMDDLIAANKQAIQDAMEATAVAHGYDSLLSACSYAAQPVGAPFQAEGAAFLKWRSEVWTQAYATLAQVEAGKAPFPTTVEAVAMMPAEPELKA